MHTYVGMHVRMCASYSHIRTYIHRTGGYDRGMKSLADHSEVHDLMIYLSEQLNHTS